MIKSEYIFMVLGMGLVTYLPRCIPLIFLAKRNLPKWFVEWLGLIPAAILSALLLPELVISGKPKQLDLLQPELLVAIPVFIIALKTRSLGITVISGMILFWLVGLT